MSNADPGVAEDSYYAPHQKIYPREISGTFSTLRVTAAWVLLGAFYLLPWVPWGERQAILFDLPARKFYLFGLTLWPQDFIFLAWLLVIAALSLFFFTAVAGRLWCGYACPQTVWTEVFLWMERVTEGDRARRMKLDAAPWSTEKLLRKSAKQFLWITFALWTGFTFVGFFTPITDLAARSINFSLGGWEAFWVLFYGFATYGNAGFMREQVCKYMCPYARFQSAMFDADTMIVSYDETRGEPRGARSRSADPRALALGECVDCTLCVQVCPTGIDIRQGLQYECIGCGACADVCDTVMDKLGYPRGLVRYTTQNGMQHRWSRAQMLRRALRPRVLVYSAILGLVCLAMAFSLAVRTPLKVDVVRDRVALARIVEGGKLENVYRLQVMNATEETQHYRITARGLPGLVLASDPETRVGPAESRWVAVRLQLPYGSAAAGSHAVHFDVAEVGGTAHVSEKSVFIVPR
ncbi:MAG: cytochrome c oxidase accessory protein CcoG [Burkholderiaceae bacterium]